MFWLNLADFIITGIKVHFIKNVEWMNGLGWKGPFGSSSSNPPAIGGDT